MLHSLPLGITSCIISLKSEGIKGTSARGTIIIMEVILLPS